jgi:hypothetical protein
MDSPAREVIWQPMTQNQIQEGTNRLGIGERVALNPAAGHRAGVLEAFWMRRFWLHLKLEVEHGHVYKSI